MTPDRKINKVCDGCWKRGVCDKVYDYDKITVCTCPCDRGFNWRHADDPRSK